MAGTPAPRTLADQLRSWPDARLTGLLRARPDLVSPAPHDSAQLASRAAVRSSLLRAMDTLTTLELGVLEALVVVGPCDLARLRSVVYAAPEAVASAAERLVDLVLAWEAPDGLRPLTGVADGFPRGVGGSGLRPRTPESDDADVAERLAALSPAARALLEHLDAHGGEGTSKATAPGSPDQATTPVEELLAHRLVQPRPGGVVALPGEVALALRSGRTTREPVDAVPLLASSPRDADLVDRSAGGAAFEAVRRVELLLDHWSTAPPTALRSGGLGVRDLKATAALLHVDEPAAALLVECAAAAGLLATGYSADGDPAWVPTDEFDTWSALPGGQRWVRLVRAWLETTRVPSLVGSKDRASKTWTALSPELSSVLAVESRRMGLSAVATLPPGEVLASGTGIPSAVALVSWLRPRRPRNRDELVAWALAEAAALGVTGLGGLSSAGRLLLDGDLDGAAAALEPLLPEPVDHLLLQADLTAVAPGPLEAGLARKLHVLADVDSRGGATVYRFTPDSVRRALDVGWSAAEIHELIRDVSRTAVPQPLTYLVDDVARTFGRLRVGHAESFLRADDETLLTELVHHPRASTLGLRRLAPTVLVSSLPLDVLLPRLRDLGAAPVVEADDGSVHIARPDRLRARTPRERRTPARAARETAQLAHVVSAIRAGDRAVAERPAPTAATASPADALALLRDAAESRRSVWIGYVDSHGATTERIVDPVAVEGGQLRAFDHRSEEVRSFAVHRITAVRGVDPAR